MGCRKVPVTLDRCVAEVAADGAGYFLHAFDSGEAELGGFFSGHGRTLS